MGIYKNVLFGLMVFYLTTMGISAQTVEFLEWTREPPMGWNSYDSFGATVTEQEVRDNAKMMAVHLKRFGWEYVVVDYCWYFPYVGALSNPNQSKDFLPSLPMDDFGRLQPALDRFPSAANGKGFKELGNHIHGLGLKFGIHIMRGIPREAVALKLPVKGTKVTADQIADTTSVCSWLNTMYGVDMSKMGAQAYYDALIQQYADWGVDYIKVDDISSPYHEEEINAIRKAIDKSGRAIVLSLSPGDGTPLEKAEHLKTRANLWRVSSDFWDEWIDLKNHFALIYQWQEHIGNGSWPDADMIPIGRLNQRGPLPGTERASRLTDTEKYTLMSLLAICKSPLMYGGDLRFIQPLEMQLLTNEKMLAINQNSINNRQLFRDDTMVVWSADEPETGNTYLALFNLDDVVRNVEVDLIRIGLEDTVTVRDVWKNTELGAWKGKFSKNIEPHGSMLLSVSPD